MEQLTIIKIGGNILDDAAALQKFLDAFAGISGAKLLVHGGGKIATEMGQKLGLQPHYVDGKRVTDAATLELVTMVYGGLLNKQLVAALQQRGCNAIGLTGADANLLPADKRPVNTVDFGFVGDIRYEAVNAPLLHQLLQAGVTPVVAPLTHDGKGQLLNTNADAIAGALARGMAPLLPVRLIYCFEKAGVLTDVQDERSVLAEVRHEALPQLKEKGIISDGMIPKLEHAFAAAAAGVPHVAIGHAASLRGLIEGTTGTRIL